MSNFIRGLVVFTILLAAYTALPYFSHHDPKELPVVATIPQRQRVLGYDRELQFGGWLSGVRENIVEQAGTIDPYSGQPLDYESAEVDHILPLSAAWDLGAYSWSAAERIEFANDPSNLILVSRSQNQEKSDHLPSGWLPEDPAMRCWYADKLLNVANSYSLPLPEKDARIAADQCGFAKLW